ncbi:lipid droplet assembly factor 1 isoform X2 [Paralichthys olivaceus]|uniref:lipid droplet assembly factor 1 isoform X2 n=1 Tax=Paralichthys olivaceus TaxID=8255 RepID=UPI0037519E5B
MAAMISASLSGCLSGMQEEVEGGGGGGERGGERGEGGGRKRKRKKVLPLLLLECVRKLTGHSFTQLQAGFSLRFKPGFLHYSGDGVEMQPSSSGTAPQRMQGSWTTLLSHLTENPDAVQVMKTRLLQYLGSHPFLTLTLMLFGAMAAVPVGLFLIFALVTTIMSAVGFVFFEVFLLFVAGLTLLCVLCGLAFFSVTVSLILNAFHISLSNVLKYYPKLPQVNVQEKETDSKTQD